MSESGIHLLLCSRDGGFARALAAELGPGFQTELDEGLPFGSNPELARWWHVALIDLRDAARQPDPTPALQLIEQICKLDPAPPVLVMLPANHRTLAQKLTAAGAFEVVDSPPNISELRLVIRRADRFRQNEWDLSRRKAEETSGHQLYDMIGGTEELQRVFGLARKIAECDVNVLITGETGTGKELLARAVHRLSPRATGPFVAFSCANLPENLVDDELFGHERGAFTGAIGLRRGKFEIADQGVLFLDEIGDLPLALQPKLLRVLQERSFERLGGNTLLSADVRVVCATHRNLMEMVKKGAFREDLFYRLNVFQLHIPPLRERRGGIPILAQHFLQNFSSHLGRNVKRISRQALHALEEHPWPGNVRELQNVIQRAIVLAEGSTIELSHLPPDMQGGFAERGMVSSYDAEVREFKRRLIVRTLSECNWNKTESARRLGVARGYLHRLIGQLQIQDKEFLEPERHSSPPPQIM